MSKFQDEFQLGKKLFILRSSVVPQLFCIKLGSIFIQIIQDEFFYFNRERPSGGERIQSNLLSFLQILCNITLWGRGIE